MYRVLIVDDEENVIVSLKESIPWASMNLEVAGEASNMAQALALAKRQPFHIVVSDIKMPGGSGLELLRELTLLSPDTQGIIVSGHADFTYAQKALECGVIGYCLKPIDPADLCTYLKKAVLRLERSDAPSREEQLAAAIAEEQTDVIRETLRSFGLNPDCFYIAAADGGSAERIHLGRGSVRSRKGRPCFFLDRPLTQMQADETVRRYHLNGLGYLTSQSSAETLPSDLRTAVAMSLNGFITGKHQAICTCGANDRAVLSQLQDTIAGRDDARLAQLLRDMQGHLPDISIGCAFRISNMVHNYRFDPSFEEDDGGYAYDLSHLLSMYGSVQEMLSDLIRLAEEPAAPADTAFESGNIHFLQIIRYIHRHYADELSLNTLADVLHMTPAYVSRLFSRESGTTYRKYLTELRVEKAKELLATTNLSIAEVCDRVGFNDYFHFIKTFKRLTGTSPGKYTGADEADEESGSIS